MFGAALFLRKYMPLLRQVVLYGVFGCFSALIDVLIFSFLSGFLSVVPSNVISVHCGISCSFLLNTFFTFKVKNNIKRRVVIFLCIGYFGLLLSMLILWIGIDKMCFDKTWVKIISVFIVAAVQFLLNKFITYRDSKENYVKKEELILEKNKNKSADFLKNSKSAAKYLLFYFTAFLIFTGIYIVSFRTPLFAGNQVFFYRAVSLLIITAVIFSIVVIIFVRYGKIMKLMIQDILIAIFIPLCLNMTFLSVVTVSIDRSISVFILSYMAENRDRAFTEKEITDIFLNVYMDKYKAMDRRFDEQLITGSIEKKEGAYQITDKGVFLVNNFRLVGEFFPIDNRFLYPEPYVPIENHK